MVRLAVCAVARDEVAGIAEWMAFHLVQGAALVRVYDDGSVDGTRELLARLAAADHSGGMAGMAPRQREFRSRPNAASTKPHVATCQLLRSSSPA